MAQELTRVTSLVAGLMDAQVRARNLQQAALIIAEMAGQHADDLVRHTALAVRLDGRTRVAEERREAASTLGRGREQRVS